MHASIQQESALVARRLAPRRLEVLRARLDHGAQARAEPEDPPELLHLLRRVQERVHEAEVLGDAEGHVRRVDMGPVPLEQLDGCGDVFGHWLLSQHVLAGGEGLLDIGGLVGDGEAVREQRSALR